MVEEKKGDKPFKHVCVLCLATLWGWRPKADHSCGYLTVEVARDYNLAEMIPESERVACAQFALLIMGFTPEKTRDYKRRTERVGTVNIPPVITGGRRTKSLFGTQSGRGTAGPASRRSRPTEPRTK
ncbi:hypothetical protein EPN90_03600 [Patescibacteria group bacterium]|nr:MAG: hypothetical protein EPN90_03600 [Patescibacteria group bacterium]